ncbi:alpha/beta hydrolase [Capnocytophaga genosp. AHN8471]|uniref:Alpha/beta hydrolase n=1 Tax=Capnocytophaga genosp. AHN8471 TaxID=327574 RepID=A0ABS1YVT0_9FLAO|nr:alpha/beta hydrolase [Capnocytophaga genosp. AHN8471]MBM0650528.1 alpha/beta hydrolase [Capnocytophaga genosp. AHN8471]MBM0661716.1 alpha/beta hydrolase [Capnocytophaga genosp. AHN8471]
MKKRLLFSTILLFSVGLSAQNKFKVTPDEARNGSYTITPQLPKDGMVKAGTVLTLKATPAEGYIFDSGYYSLPGQWGAMFYEQATPQFKVKVDKDMNVGACFVPQAAEANLKVVQDVVYAQPGVKPLKYDVYSPQGKQHLPCIVIIHGGGWSSNTESVMRGLARELANSGKYIVFNIDYRWIGTLDGDKKPTELYQIVEDVYGALLHIMENAAKYGGDNTKLFLTGDSAGGHLSASAANFIERVGDRGFGKIQGVYEFIPTYMPKGKTITQARNELAKAIKATAPSYGVFRPEMLTYHFKDYPYLNEIAPINSIPQVSQRPVPQLLLRGSEDGLIKDEEVKAYERALAKAGQRVEYTQVGGANHAFFDWKPDTKTQATFNKYGKYHAHEMLLFFDSVLESLNKTNN